MCSGFFIGAPLPSVTRSEAILTYPHTKRALELSEVFSRDRRTFDDECRVMSRRFEVGYAPLPSLASFQEEAAEPLLLKGDGLAGQVNPRP